MPNISPELSASLDAVERLLHDEALAAWPTRADDLALVARARERLERRFTLAVVGEFSSGKSYLLNALLGKSRFDAGGRVVGLLATDINPSTATITELEYGATESAVARYPSGRTERIPLDSLSRFVAVGKNDAPGAIHDATADEDAAPAFVVVSIDSPFLASGFAVADTPGLASLNPAHRRATLAYLPRADAVLYLIDTQQPFTEGDASFLGLIGEHVRTIFIVQTKIDLWRMPEGESGAAWEAARARIALRAARYAPEAVVYSVSAHDYAAGTLRGDDELVRGSGFPELLSGLDRSLEIRAGQARVTRTMSVLREVTGKTANRVRRAAALDESDAATLRHERERALAVVVERERALVRERDEVAQAGAERRRWIVAQGDTLAERVTRALGAAIDVADIGRIRDRGKFHSLVDATVAPIFTAFAADVAGHVARALERIAKSRPEVRVADLAARRLGGEPGTGAWARDLASGITATIVLGAIGGPAVAFVHGVASAFASKPHGSYMKRELGSDLAATFFPHLEGDIAGFVDGLAATLGGVYDDTAAAIERERSVARAESLDPIDLALARAGDGAARRQARTALARVVARLAKIDAMLESVERQQPQAAPAAKTGRRNGSARDDAEIPFDADAYDRGLRPERYRVVLLGALRRGKSSLINAIAGTRLLQDEGGVEALFPIHVRYGERDRAYALEREGVWNEIVMGEAVTAATRSPALIETPWTMPRQLVLVHAPAFDSGNPEAERIALAAAAAASEIVGLFSRQLSETELALYARVAELAKPMLLAHTIADNETGAERRTVVELAARYLRERGIGYGRIFTISALDYLEAAQTKRAPAPWNELGALRDTLATQAEEHMSKLAGRARRDADLARISAEPREPSTLRRSLGRFFGR